MKKIFLLISFVLLVSTLSCEEQSSSNESAPTFRVTSRNVTGDISGMNSETYSYNESGNISTVISRSADGEEISMTSYEYDSNELMVKMIRTTNGETTITEFKYNKDHQRIQASTKNMNGVAVKTIDYAYNENGYISTKVVRDVMGDVSGSINYTYENKEATGYGEEFNRRVFMEDEF